MTDEKRRDSSTATPPPSTGAPEQQPTSRRRGGGQKRKSTSLNSGGGGSNSQSSKRQAREKAIAVPFTPIHSNGPCTRARVQPNNSGFALEEIEAAVVKSGDAAAAEKIEEVRRVSEQNWEALEAEIEEEYDKIRSRDASLHVVPVHAGWFSWTEIHPLEKRMLPSFFSGKAENRTPEIYMEIRNWIMKKFHLNPKALIELEHLSELNVGESDARQEVMEFLDYWGLINYHPFPQNEPTAMSVDSDETGKVDSLIEKLFKFETKETWSPVVPRVNAAVPTTSPGLFPEPVIADELVKSEEPAVDYHCNSCSADCSRKRYHCQKQADFDLCAECFTNGKFGSDMFPSDFILMEPAEAGGASGGKWTDQETLLLLEAIEIFKDNWSEIAEHVATKTKSQCILHFVQMPIEDAFFNQDKENSPAPKENELPAPASTEHSPPKEDQDGDAAPKDDHDKTESQVDATENKDSSSPMEISKLDDVKDSDGSHEVEDSFAQKALKEAFEVVGGPSLPGESLSFAEAGNPVMTLAAFLVRLVEPNIATASVRRLLKSLSSCRSSEQFAARHCFHLEDPPDDKKNLEGATTGTIELEAAKHENEDAGKQNEDKPDSVTDEISLQDQDKDKNKDSAPEEHKEKKDFPSDEQKHVASPSSECAKISDAVKEPDGMVTDEAQPASMDGPRNSDKPEEQTPKTAEESIVLASPTELQANPGKDSENGASNGNDSQSKEPQEMISNSEKKETELLATSNLATEKEKGDTKAKECDSEKKETLVIKKDLETKLRQAAVAALSAAAVKAKLLADHEEDQIRQLATLLIEKQLLKLETKLAFFNDMENVVMRVKEQLDRSKQRLFHERAQIIATRFGMSASARPTTQALPPNRASVTFPNSASRPFMGMNALKPPISRPIMTPNPTSGNITHTSAAGSSVQQIADNISSVGTK